MNTRKRFIVNFSRESIYDNDFGFVFWVFTLESPESKYVVRHIDLYENSPR
jgi:hypothetical protein